MPRAFSCCFLVLFASCGMPVTNGFYRGEPLVTVRGQLTVGAGRSVADPVKLTVAWFAPTTPWRPGPVLSSTAWSELYSQPYPVHFVVQAFAPPPNEALRDLSPSGGTGVGAEGVILAYQDGNSNGILDLVNAGETSPDTILGTSLGDAGSGYRLLYVDGIPMSDPPGLQTGYNLVHSSQGVAAFSTSIAIVLTGTPDLQSYLCRARAPDGDTGSGDPCAVMGVAPPLKVVGSIGIPNGSSAIELSVEDEGGVISTAALTVNERAVPYDSTKQRYAVFDSANQILSPDMPNQIQVRATGYANLDLSVQLPGSFQITFPAFDALLPNGAPVTVAWNSSAKAIRYRVRIFDQSFKTLFDGQTKVLNLTTPPIVYSGNATLNVQAEIDDVRTSEGSLVVPYVNMGRPLRFQ